MGDKIRFRSQFDQKCRHRLQKSKFATLVLFEIRISWCFLQLACCGLKLPCPAARKHFSIRGKNNSNNSSSRILQFAMLCNTFAMSRLLQTELFARNTGLHADKTRASDQIRHAVGPCVTKFLALHELESSKWPTTFWVGIIVAASPT